MEDTAGSPVDVKWLDASHVTLTYPARLPILAVGTACAGVEVAHVQKSTERNLRGYVCLDPGAETFQLCGRHRRDRWALLDADKAKGWRAVRADAHAVEPPNVPTPLCNSERVYVEMSGVVGRQAARSSASANPAPEWEITATEFTYEAPIPRGECRQYWNPVEGARP
jgi:hypothetical protein